MKHLGIIGASGMIGSDLAQYLSPHYRVTGITRSNYVKHKGHQFDILINANGNNKRFWANEHPLEDFLASTVSTYQTLMDFRFKTYIYLSSSDVYPRHDAPRYTTEHTSIDSSTLCPYGLHKYISEQIVQRFADSYLILRLSMVLGTRLRKGPVYDALHGQPLYVTRQSAFQIISTDELARIINTLLQKGKRNQIYNVGGIGTASIALVESMLNVTTKQRTDARRQRYHMCMDKLHELCPLKQSKTYLHFALANQKNRIV